MRTAPRVAATGKPATRTAANAAIIATMSGLFLPSYCRAWDMTCTSALYPSGNIGRTARSIRRIVSVSLIDGRPSRLKKPPGILPADSGFSR